MSLRYWWAWLNDSVLGIQTRGESNADRTLDISFSDNQGYASPDYYYIRKTVRVLKPSADDVIYDIGCGKGRVLCVFARNRVSRCVGIEASTALCQIAVSNASKVRGRRCPIEIVCEDAAKVKFQEGTIFYFYNPFGAGTMVQVLRAIEQSVKKNPRSIRIVYHNSVCRNILLSTRWLRNVYSFKTFAGSRVDFFASK